MVDDLLRYRFTIITNNVVIGNFRHIIWLVTANTHILQIVCAYHLKCEAILATAIVTPSSPLRPLAQVNMRWVAFSITPSISNIGSPSSLH